MPGSKKPPDDAAASADPDDAEANPPATGRRTRQNQPAVFAEYSGFLSKRIEDLQKDLDYFERVLRGAQEENTSLIAELLADAESKPKGPEPTWRSDHSQPHRLSRSPDRWDGAHGREHSFDVAEAARGTHSSRTSERSSASPSRRGSEADERERKELVQRSLARYGLSAAAE